MTEAAERRAELERALELAAERLGDVVPPVMARFYARFPDGRASFEYHAAGTGVERLEAEMVGNCLYFITTWIDRPREIEFLAMTSVPHHVAALQVPPDWYSGLLVAAVDVLGEASPEAADLWRGLRHDFEKLIAAAAEE